MKIKLALFVLFSFTVFGLHFLMEYSGKPGVLQNTRPSWPESSKLSRPQENHIVMFVHPGCSCSKASVAELSRLMSQAPHLSAQLVVMKGPKLESLLQDNPLVKAAMNIPRVKVVYDHDGREAKLFQAQTSGLTHLYDSKALLVFAGGLTMARGHEGESEGKNAILSYLKGEQSKSTSLVFGCDLFDQLKKLTMVK